MDTIKAYAKINLALEVLGKRNDGYHEVSTVLHAVGIADYLTFKPSVGLTLVSNISAIHENDNLVIKAAKILQKATNCFAGAEIHLEKQIPLSSGLGGGSSDAAAVVSIEILARLGALAADCTARAIARGVFEAESTTCTIAYRDKFFGDNN